MIGSLHLLKARLKQNGVNRTEFKLALKPYKKLFLKFNHPTGFIILKPEQRLKLSKMLRAARAVMIDRFLKKKQIEGMDEKIILIDKIIASLQVEAEHLPPSQENEEE